MGIKTYADNVPLGQTAIKSRPFIELNYIHNSNPYSARIDDVSYKAEGGRDVGELRLGLESRLANEHQLWFDVSYAAGRKNNRETALNLGWKYEF